jgi:hypothetical protein
MGYTDFEPFEPFVSTDLAVVVTEKYGKDPDTGEWGRTLVAHRVGCSQGDVLFSKGDLILELSPHFKREADQHSARIDANLHQFSPVEEAVENFINHSCDPSGRWDWSRLSSLHIPLIALRDIHEGDEITYNYLTTDEGRAPGEDVGEDDFVCACGAECCRKEIIGFRPLSPSEKKELEPIVSPYLRSILREQELGG